MSSLLEILGEAITIDTADLIWYWLREIRNNNDDQSAQSQCLDKVISLASDMKSESAKQQLRLYLFDNPSCIYGRLAAAAINISEGQLTQAIEELNSIYMRQPNNTMALYALAHCHERLGNQQEAIEFYQDCLKFKNYLQLPRQRLAAIYLQNRQLEKTIMEYELLRNEYPDNITALVLLGYLHIANAEFPKAVDAFNNAILIHPDNFSTISGEIDDLLKNGNHYQALEKIDQMLERQPDKPELLLKRADILNMMGSVYDGIEQYEYALKLCPDFLEATIKLGVLYLHNSERRLAAKQFNKAFEINEQIVDAYVGLSTAQNLGKNEQEALSTLSLASAIQPNSIVLFAQTAILQFEATLSEQDLHYDKKDSLNIIETIINTHRRQISQNPRNPDLLYRLGLLMISIENIEEAIQAFKAVLEINPTFNRARNKLAICMFETNKQKEALSYLTLTNCLDTDTLLLHYKTALLYCDSVKFASSLLNLEQNIQENYVKADATTNISVILQNLGLLDRASAMWDNMEDTANHAINSNYLL